MNNSQQNGQRRRVIVLRHGERVDFAFGSSWIQNSFNESRNYVRTDTNMPETLQQRNIEDWAHDTPLTTLGNIQAKLVGSSLKSSDLKLSKVFVSPSYRCLQTATEVLKGMGLENKLPLNVEYGLFEWMNWYDFGPPNWLTDKEREMYFKVNNNYEPIVNRKKIQSIVKESFTEFADRNAQTTEEILKNCEGDILIVAHATNLETCTRRLTGRGHRKMSDLKTILLSIPYLGAVAMQQTDDSSSYQLVDPPCLTLTHKSCPKFDWRILDDQLKSDL